MCSPGGSALAFRPLAYLPGVISLGSVFGWVVGTSWTAPRGCCRVADTAWVNAGEEKGFVPGWRRTFVRRVLVTIPCGGGSPPAAAAIAMPPGLAPLSCRSITGLVLR